jgi:hypothetical protein
MTLNATVGVMPVPTVMTSVLSAAGGGVAAHPMLAPDTADRLDGGDHAPDTADCLDGGDRKDQRPLRRRTKKGVGEESVVVGEAEETSSSERGGTTS